MIDFNSNNDGCVCEGPNIEVRDTVCGRNNLTNLFNLLIFATAVFYFIGTLVLVSLKDFNFRFRTRLRLLLVCILLHALSKL